MIDGGLKGEHRSAIIDVIAANDRVERAVLFGSRAMGTNTVTSDVDIALYGDSLTLTDQARLAGAIGDIPMAQSVELVLYDSIDNPAFREHIQTHGVEWYRRAKAERLDLLSKHRRVLEALLRKHLPDVEVWAYGSRVNGRSHDGSDLDLVLRGPGLKKIPIDCLAEFEEAVRESNIPFLVEARDWARLPERFHGEIERDHVVLLERRGGKLSGRKITYLGDVAEIEMGQSPSGATVSGCQGLPLLNGPTEFGPYHPVPVQFTTEPRKYSQCGDILFCVRGSTTGRMNWADQRYAIGRGVSAIRHKHELALQPFIRAVIEFALPDLLAHATGSTFPNIAAHQLAAIPYPEFDKNEQLAIAHVLGTLDNKIELNRRMNETLEAMARALFKSWFVNFEPVRAKMEGRDPGMPQSFADMFPDRMVESKIGEIPEGWERQPVYTFADVVYGAPFASRQFNNDKLGVPLIRIRDLSTHEPGVSTEQVHKKGHLIKPGDIVAGMDGEFRLHVWKGPIAWLNQRVCHFEPKSGVPTAFLAEALRAPLAFFEYGKVGTTVIHLGKSDIDTFRLLQPGRGLLSAFASIAQPLLDRTVANALESRSLAQTRDLLLPRLISGKIRLREAELAMEGVA